MSKLDDQSAESVITVSNRLKAGPIAALSAQSRAVYEDRWQIWTSFKRNFFARYRNTVLGVAWSFIIPLVPIVAYLTLGVIFSRLRPELPYAVFVGIGFAIYSLISWPITGLTASFRSEWSLFAKMRLAASTVVVSSLGHQLWDFFVRVLGVLFIIYFYAVTVSPMTIVAMLVLINGIMLGLSIGIFVMLGTAIVPDIEHAFTVVLRFLIFFSGVIFPIPDTGRISEVIIFNPFYTFVNEFRSMVVFGEVQNLEVLLITIGISTLLFVFATTILYRTENHLRGLSL